jgi:hypothetical protein
LSEVLLHLEQIELELHTLRLVAGRKDSVRPEDSKIVNLHLNALRSAPSCWVFEIELESSVEESLYALPADQVPLVCLPGSLLIRRVGNAVVVLLDTGAALPGPVGVVFGESERWWWLVGSCHDGGNVGFGCVVVLC